jgi:predicted nicotinamide N-methyase
LKLPTDLAVDAVSDPVSFIKVHTALHEPPLVPELKLHLATEGAALWEMGEAELDATGLPAPFWAFAWAGGQALARYLLDNPLTVSGKHVLDFGSGSGLVGLAALQAGAASVLCADIDQFACAAATLNAEANALPLSTTTEDLVGEDGPWNVILVGDMCYEQPLAGEVEAWLRNQTTKGISVLIGDPGRTYLPKDRLDKLVSYGVKTSRALEDTDVRNTSVWQFVSSP